MGKNKRGPQFKCSICKKEATEMCVTCKKKLCKRCSLESIIHEKHKRENIKEAERKARNEKEMISREKQLKIIDDFHPRYFYKGNVPIVVIGNLSTLSLYSKRFGVIGQFKCHNATVQFLLELKREEHYTPEYSIYKTYRNRINPESFLCSTSKDGTAKVWEIISRKCINSRRFSIQGVDRSLPIAQHDPHQLLVLCKEGQVYLWNWLLDQLITSLQIPLFTKKVILNQFGEESTPMETTKVAFYAISPTKYLHLFLVSFEHALEVWDFSGDMIAQFPNKSRAPKVCELASGDIMVVSGQRIYILDPSSPTELKTLPIPVSQSQFSSFCTIGENILTGTKEGILTMWEISDIGGVNVANVKLSFQLSETSRRVRSLRRVAPGVIMVSLHAQAIHLYDIYHSALLFEIGEVLPQYVVGDYLALQTILY